MSRAFRSALLFLVVVPPLLGFVATLYAGWPGAISPDMAETISEATYLQFPGQQAPLFGLVWSLPLAILPLSVAVAAFYLLQLGGYWLTFVLFALGSARRRSLIGAAVASLAGFLPPLFSFSVMVESNMQAGVAWALAIAVAFAFPNPVTLYACLPLIFYGLIVRSGLIVALPAILFACVVQTRPAIPRTKAVILSAVFTSGFALISLVITTLLPGAPTRGRILAISELFDIAGVYQRTGTHCVPASLVPEGTTAEAIMALYDPSLASSLVWETNRDTFVLPDSEADLASLRSCWIQTVRSHPKEFLFVKTRFALLFLMVGVQWAPATAPDSSSNQELGLAVPHNSLSSVIHGLVERSRTTLLWKGWFWLALCGASCAVALALGFARAGAALGVYAAATGTLVPHLLFGQGALSRYYFLPYILFVACLLLLGIWTDAPETDGTFAGPGASA